MMGPSRYVTMSDGARLAVWESGPRDAPALLFLHGFPENHRAWRHQIAHLAQRFYCVAPDLRGYGLSSKPAAVADYATPRLVRDVAELAAALGLERFTLIGHDWGGLVAFEAAALPQVERLVVANAPHAGLFQRLLYTDAAQRAASQYIKLLRDASVDVVLAEKGLGPVLLQAFGAGAFRAMERQELGALMAQWADPATAFAMVNWYRASGIVVPEAEAEAPALSAALIRCTTLVIWGEADEALLPANVEGLGEFVPDLRVTRLPDVGHFSPWQAAEAVNAALDAFL